jgi:hypothetical protein
MASKAELYTTTLWISLRDARALVVEAYGATQLAEKLLTKWLGQGLVRWSCKRFEAARLPDLAERQRKADAAFWFLDGDVAYSEGDPAFWRRSLEINWEESWASQMYVERGNKAYGIRVAREDVLAQLPEQPGDREAATLVASARWIAAEARHMKGTGQIPSRITDFAKELAQRMDKAADSDRSLRRLKWQSIRNRLHEWKLWPETLIK